MWIVYLGFILAYVNADFSFPDTKTITEKEHVKRKIDTTKNLETELSVSRASKSLRGEWYFISSQH